MPQAPTFIELYSSEETQRNKEKIQSVSWLVEYDLKKKKNKAGLQGMPGWESSVLNQEAVRLLWWSNG